MTYQFRKPARAVQRVFIHCSASDNPAHDNVATIDAWHKANGWAGIGYHFFIRKNGLLELGRDLEKVPAAQKGHNTGSIAICLHGLEKAAFTIEQFDTLRTLCQQIDKAYRGNVTFHGHCEVANKACPVFDYPAVLDLDAQGHIKRDSAVGDGITVVGQADGNSGQAQAKVLQLGSKGAAVMKLQQMLSRLGYFPGGIDGDFGTLTRSAVLAFQADNDLMVDGIVGLVTDEMLTKATPRKLSQEREAATLADLAEKGSTVAKSARGTLTAGGVLAIGGLGTVIDEIADHAQIAGRVLDGHGAVVGGIILLVGLFVAWQAWRSGQAHLDDHRSGKSM